MITCNGHPVLSGTVHLPRVGVWHADLELDHAEPLSGAVTIVAGATRFLGTVTRSDSLVGRTSVRVVGGAGGLRQSVGAQAYVGSSAEACARDLLSAVGERLSATSDASLLGRTLTHWHRATGPAGTALTRLVEHLGGVWRVLEDGTVWVGRESYPAQTFEHTTLDPDPLQGTHTITSDGWTLRPGVTFAGRRVSRVEHSVGSRGVRTVYWAEEDQPDGSPASLDRIKDHLAKFVRWVMRDVTYHRTYSAVVQRQDDLGLLDLYPDDDAIRGTGTSRVPIRHGLPGCSVRVPVGTRVLLGFENGDPSRPYASLWSEGSFDSISLGNGDRPIARAGDNVLVFLQPGVPIPLLGAIQDKPPPAPPSPLVGVTMTITGPVVGIIQAGNPKILG